MYVPFGRGVPDNHRSWGTIVRVLCSLSRAKERFAEPVRLVDRGVLHVKGSDCLEFLQGLVTVDVCQSHRDTLPSVMYGAVLKPNGRILSDIFLHFISQRSILLDLDKEAVEPLTRCLRQHRLRAKVEFANVSKSYSVWVSPLRSHHFAGAQNWSLDPRGIPELGSRAILPVSRGPAGDAIFQENRWRAGIAEGVAETTGLLPLEANFVQLRGVSFTKGCYVGQELTTRTYHQGVIRKRVLPLKIFGYANVGDILMRGDLKVGRVIACGPAGGHGIGLMTTAKIKFNEASLRIQNRGAMACVVEPAW
eukprot:CAMPEP_0183790276 /NCGR_PEP_ID=MMETSP0803_2-20130417/921_1 /TAXON_ID=195967 /ORGANISM="Crustomastix stigmata, Strain CCMP3273" /LENGTH=306 /DNA_ID=CAMNT_0026034479 /DNA_START=304 /DNA_END=1221 /DNA_ORIENTATION=-